MHRPTTTTVIFDRIKLKARPPFELTLDQRKSKNVQGQGKKVVFIFHPFIVYFRYVVADKSN